MELELAYYIGDWRGTYYIRKADIVNKCDIIYQRGANSHDCNMYLLCEMSGSAYCVTHL